MLENVKKQFASATYVACTSDIWSKDRRSFIAVNVHWVDEISGELKSFLLACERFRGNETSAAIQEKIKLILKKYGIEKKAVCITTDNAANYACAFERGGDNYQTYHELMATIDDDDNALFQLDLNDLALAWCPAIDVLPNSCDVMPLSAAAAKERVNEVRTNSSSDSDDDDDEFNTHTVASSIRIRDLPNMDNILDPEKNVKLPNRIACAAHSLNLVGKLDSFDALIDEDYKTRYTNVFVKLNAIWKVSSTRLGRECFSRYLNGKVIYKPHRIRWNRIYDAVK